VLLNKTLSQKKQTPSKWKMRKHIWNTYNKKKRLYKLLPINKNIINKETIITIRKSGNPISKIAKDVSKHFIKENPCKYVQLHYFWGKYKLKLQGGETDLAEQLKFMRVTLSSDWSVLGSWEVWVRVVSSTEMHTQPWQRVLPVPQQVWELVSQAMRVGPTG
jgi:hypothetical protein